MTFVSFSRRLAFALCVNLCLATVAASAELPVDLELVLAADISGSMDREEAALQLDGYVRALRHPDVVDAIQRGPLVRIEEWTSISTVITVAAKSFKNNGFVGERRIIDVSGDGPNNQGAYVVGARNRAMAEGIVINGLPIINDRPGRYGFPPLPDLDLYYEDCVIGGEGAFIVVAEGFEDFARAILRKLVLEIAGTLPAYQPVQLVASKSRPPCNIGEVQLDNWRPDILHDF